MSLQRAVRFHPDARASRLAKEGIYRTTARSDGIAHSVARCTGLAHYAETLTITDDDFSLPLETDS
ncbi:MAG: hypothetical protein ACK5AC_15310 [Planctomycetota bacterium]